MELTRDPISEGLDLDSGQYGRACYLTLHGATPRFTQLIYLCAPRTRPTNLVDIPVETRQIDNPI